MADLVSPIVDIISRLWTCCATHTRYLRKLQENKILLSTAMNELKEARDDVQRRVLHAEADPNEPKKRTDPVSGWLQRVETIEGEVEVILQKADAQQQQQLGRGRCFGGCCPPNKCRSNYKLGKLVVMKKASVDELKVKGKFEEVTYVVNNMSYLSKLQENKILLRNAMDELKNMRNDVQRRVVKEEADSDEPKKRTDHVSGWLQSVEKIEDEVKVILQTSDEQLSGAACHEKNNLVVMKMASVGELKMNFGNFQEVTYVVNNMSYLNELQENKILLRNAMDELKNMRNDVQRRVVKEEADPDVPKKRTDHVSGWLQSVEKIEDEVKVILQTSDEQLSSAGCHEKNKLVVMKMASVGELKMTFGNLQEVTYILPPPPVQDMNLESTVGMESIFDKVWTHITSKNDNKFNVIGLYGHGGVGKTTLLKKINNEYNKICGEHGFDHIVMFVVVSKPIDYLAIQKKIGEKLGFSIQGDGDESSRADKIFKQLRNKNFVILLDDIWERVDLLRIGIPSPPPQDNSSKVIFTTRNKQVCGLMDATHKFQVECLPWEKAWRLFQDKVGEEALKSLSGEDERKLVMDVAKECGGLPLALITIGRAMSTKTTVEEWRDAKTTLQSYASQFKDVRDEVLPRLKLSYDNLPNETEKSCFRYCALFPEDYSININKLIDYWIAEGFLDGFDKKLDAARNRGHTIIGRLKSACMLESSDYGQNYVKMHDVIRDLALWIVNGCRSTDESGSNSDNNNKFLVAVNEHPCKKWENAERIFWDIATMGGRRRNEEDEKPPTFQLKKLKTLIVKNKDRNYCLPQSFFQHMPLLRVLDLSEPHGGSDVEFPISICELHELQYLNLARIHIKEFPVELRKLVKLKFLISHGLKRIPAGLIANLSELQVLDLRGFENWELGENGPSFSELDGLKQLQEFRITILTFVALEKFVCNRKLQMVCTGLYFHHCSSSQSRRVLRDRFSEVEELVISSSSQSRRRVLDLSNFKSIRYLEIIEGFSEVEELVILYGDGGGGLLSTLETLRLDALFKLNSILWMADAVQPYPSPASHFHSLHSIRISCCFALKDLTWLVYVENLMTLNVWHCQGLETVIDYLGGDEMLNKGGGGVFSRLKTLQLLYLPKLKSICRHTLAFPSIEDIAIKNCPELKKLPLGSGSNVNNTLQRIEGSARWWNKLEWEDETIKSKFLPYYCQWQ